MILILIISIAAFIAVLLWFLHRDLKKWGASIPIDHGGKSVLRRLLFQLPSAIGFIWFADWNLWAFPVAYLMMNFTWWEFFDGIFNIRRNFHWRFNGSFNDPGHTDPWTDKLLRRMAPWQQAVLKWSLIGISVFIYIKICING